MMPMFQVSAADKALHGSFLDLKPSEVQEFFQSKYWGAYYCAHYGAPALSDGGSITLFSGVTFHACWDAPCIDIDTKAIVPE